jgi:putative hemolysin
MLAMVAVNAVFAGYEIALAAVSTARLRALAQGQRAGARAALYMKENVEGSLAALQLGSPCSALWRPRSAGPGLTS